MMRVVRRVAVVTACVAAGAAVVVGSGANADVAPGPDAAKVERSDRLASAPTVEMADGTGAYDTPAAARAAAGRAAADVPLPDGANVSGIRWEEAGGRFSAADVAFLVQYNALCQWTRAAAEGREVATADVVRRAMPKWSALRSIGGAGPLTRAVNDATSAEAATLRAECTASHAREVAWSTQLALVPSR